MNRVFKAIRNSSIGVFFAGIVTVISGCTAREGALFAFLLLGLQFCSGNPPNTLYWTQFSDDETSIFKCDLNGTLPCTPETVVTDNFTGEDLSAVEVDPIGGFLYWAIQNTGGMDGFIRRCSLKATKCVPETVGNIGNTTADQILIDSAKNFAYWADGDGFIRGCSLASLPCTLINVSNQGLPGFWFGIEQFNGVLFATGNEPDVVSCSFNNTSTCTLRRLATADNARALKVDPKRSLLYVAITDANNIHRCSLATPGCSLELIATSTGGFPSALGVDVVRNDLYWRAADTNLTRCSLDGPLPCQPEQVIVNGVRVRQLDLGP